MRDKNRCTRRKTSWRRVESKKKTPQHSGIEPGSDWWKASPEGLPGVLGNMRTKEKYHREHEPVLGNTGTTIKLCKFSLRRDVHSLGLMRKVVAVLNREQMRKT